MQDCWDPNEGSSSEVGEGNYEQGIESREQGAGNWDWGDVAVYFSVLQFAKKLCKQRQQKFYPHQAIISSLYLQPSTNPKH